MDTSYEAHCRSETFLMVAHRAWCDRYRVENAMGEYRKWRLRIERAENLRIWYSIMFLLAVIAVTTQIIAGHLSWPWSSAAGMLLMFSYCTKREAGDLNSHGSTPNQWNLYQEDLALLLTKFPVFEREYHKVHEPEDAKRIVGAELEPYGRQVDAKQYLGFIVDAEEDRNEMFSMGSASFKFGFSGSIDQYFPAKAPEAGKEKLVS